MIRLSHWLKVVLTSSTFLIYFLILGCVGGGPHLSITSGESLTPPASDLTDTTGGFTRMGSLNFSTTVGLSPESVGIVRGTSYVLIGRAAAIAGASVKE